MKRNFTLALMAFIALTMKSQVTMSPLFTDNMVMQQKTNAPVWGKSQPGKKITVATSWNKHKYETVADSNGKWRVEVNTPKAGGPYEIEVSDGKPVKLSNVMIGEVWLCSGQSNMDMPINGWSHVDNHEQELKAADHKNIRLLKVDYTISMQPQDDFKAIGNGWQVCSAKTVEQFSAVAYFFGRDLEKYRNVPVGLIQSSWGGTPAEAWTSRNTLGEMEEFENDIERIANMPDNKELRAKKHVDELNEWLNSFNTYDTHYNNGTFDYCKTDFDDSDWDDTTVPGYIKNEKYATFDGMILFRKVIEIPEKMEGRELTLYLGAVDDDDITYFNDTQIGCTSGPASIREYKIPAGNVKAGKAVITVRSIDNGGFAGITGYNGQSCRITDNNGSTIELNGMWKSKISTPLAKISTRPRDPVNDPKNVCVLYNGMINPLVGYSIKGAIWYQGEDNANRAWQYRDLMPLMIKDWREKWNYDLPFYMVQLANFMQQQPQPGESKWAELREAQHMTAKRLEKCGMACIIDIGDANDIHPRNKQDVGHRLALAARHNTYGEKKIIYSGPEYHYYKVEGSKIRITFSHTADGLSTADGDKPKGFSIAGPDHKFHWAKATIEGNSVVVWSENVKNPVAVRYAWADNPNCNLINSAKLPAIPFRTDDWPGLTYKNVVY